MPTPDSSGACPYFLGQQTVKKGANAQLNDFISCYDKTHTTTTNTKLHSGSVGKFVIQQ